MEFLDYADSLIAKIQDTMMFIFLLSKKHKNTIYKAEGINLEGIKR